ncbi:tRNA (guanine(46)-N(7))-methyltransferase TrmB [Deinococcus ruber]|uniref:tRNA (guanine-N(7)-)-methyltransferase n=1 Tax=Deinococcus ruber TaxID=1848197 RepID=A0A918CAA7_9DEIO|nr:tRNA (guanine-N7)-methyltransferase [Deinococcus ruber]GGR12380.1 tRNA (guanine-N(7)-)-methyltransferase [Deinococcus ruber]
MILQLSQFHFPDDPARLFPDSPERDLYLEIGFGDGRFWPQYLQSFEQPPNYLGVEVSGASMQKAQRRLERLKIGNAHLTKLPALVMLDAVIPEQSLSGIIVNFPDPWPKQDHLDMRLLRVPFFRLAASRLKAGGAVLLTTDHEEYFEFACREAQESGVMTVERGTAPPAALETKYAVKWRELGLDVQHARFTPTAHPALPRPDIRPYPNAALPQETDAVPHAILTNSQQLDLSDFEKSAVRGPGYTVVLLDAYRSLRRPELTVLAHIEEGELTQEVLVGITHRSDGSTLVRLAKFGGPIITAGVKAAVAAVTAELQQRGGVITHTGY